MMKKKKILDLLMLIGLVFLMAFQVTGQLVHEYIGLITIGLFILHQILNIRWYKKLFNGQYNSIRIIQTIINFLILLLFLALAYSGMGMSQVVGRFMSFQAKISFVRKLHLFCSYWFFLVISLHIGMHWNMFIQMINKLKKKKNNNKIIARLTGAKTIQVAAFLIFFYGSWVFIDSRIYEYMFLKTEFVFFDYTRSGFSVFMDSLSLLGAGIFIGYYLLKGIQKRQRRKRKTAQSVVRRER